MLYAHEFSFLFCTHTHTEKVREGATGDDRVCMDAVRHLVTLRLFSYVKQQHLFMPNQCPYMWCMCARVLSLSQIARL